MTAIIDRLAFCRHTTLGDEQRRVHANMGMPTDQRSARPTLLARLLVTLGVAAAAAAIAWVKVSEEGYASDFALFWVAGRAVLDGLNPYVVVQAGGPYNFDGGFMYPMPAAILVAPLARLSIFYASILFPTIGFACLAFAMTRDGWWRLPVLMGFPTLWCLRTGQWAPLVMAAALSPGFAWAAACKPTLGFAAFLWRPSWRFILIAGVLTLATVAIYPSWPSDWLTTTRTRS